MVAQAVILPSNLPQLIATPGWLRWGVQVPFLLSPLIPLAEPLNTVLGGGERSTVRALGRARWLVGAAVVIHVAANLVVLTVGPRAMPPGSTAVSGAHVLTTSVLAVPVILTSAVAGWRGVGAVAVLAGVLQVVVRVRVGHEGLGDCYLDTTFTLALGVLVAVSIMWVLRRARELDERNRALATEREATVRAAARLSGRRVVAGLVHDCVLHALVMARPDRLIPVERVNAEAARALAVLGPRAGTARWRTVGELVERLRDAAGVLADDEHRFEIRAHGSLSAQVPARAWGDLALAAEEAMRNVVRHAGAPSRTVRCQVLVRASGPAMRVEIRDDGVWRTLVALVAVTTVILLPLSGSWERSGRQLGAVLLVASTAPAVIMAGWHARPWPSNHGWVLAFAVLALSLLLFRGLYLLALACFVVLTGSFLLGCAVAGADVGRIVVEYIPYQVSCFLFAVVASGAMRLTEARVVRAAREAGLERTRRLVRTVEQHERERLLDEVVEIAGPVLEELAVCEVIDDDLRVRCVVLEARLRDRIRAPRLVRDETLAGATDSARRRGAVVLLMDDSTTFPEPGAAPAAGELAEAAVSPALRREALRVLATAGAGDRVVVRLCPAHTTARATIRCLGADGRFEFVELARVV